MRESSWIKLIGVLVLLNGMVWSANVGIGHNQAETGIGRIERLIASGITSGQMTRAEMASIAGIITLDNEWVAQTRNEAANDR